MPSLIPKSQSSRIIKFVTLGCLLLVLSGCETPSKINPWADKKPVPACPTIQLLKDTDMIVAYRPGPGRDITDIRFEAELKEFTGECEYIGKKGVYSSVNVVLKVGFDITRGAAEKSSLIDVSYFIAMPEFYPKPAGRNIFRVRVAFPDNGNAVKILDEEVEISIPLSGSRKGPGSKIYIGFQLTPDQIEFNRRERQTPRVN